MSWNRQEMFRWLGTLGAALIVAGAIRYAIEVTLEPLAEGMLIGGGVLFLASLAGNYRDILAFARRRSARLGANTAILAAAVLAILVAANIVGYRHHKRFDVTSEQLYSLSDQTQKVVTGLKTDVQVLRFAKRGDDTLADRMAEYSNLSHHIHYQNVDPQERPDLAKQYGATHMGQVIVTSGSHNQTLENTDESDITNAILKVTRDTVKNVCFVEGHGEKSISGKEGEGYSTVAEELSNENYQTKSINLVASNDVPFDCSVLIDAGPTKAFFPQETAMVKKYLDNGGKALLLIDPQTDPQVADILQEWNIKMGDNLVIDASGVGRMFGTGPAVPLVTDYGSSPITRNFERTMTFFPLARTVAVADNSKMQVETTELLKTSPASFAVNASELKGNQVKFDPAKDARGPLSLGVAAQRRLEAAGNNQAGNKTARLVVIGDSDFATNRYASLQRNGDLFLNTVNWLAEDEDLISIRPKSPQNRRVDLTEAQQRGLQWLSVVLLPVAVVLGGVYVWWRRR